MKRRSDTEIRADLAQQLERIVRKFDGQVRQDSEREQVEDLLRRKRFREWPILVGQQ